MNLPLRRWTVSQQLMLLLLVVVLPVLAIFAWLFSGAWHSTTEQAYARVQLLADSSARRLATELAESEAVLRRIAERPRVRALDPAACDPVIAEYVSLQPEFNNLAVRALDATLVCTYRPTAPPAAQVAATPWFRQAVQAEGFRIGDAFLGSATRRWVAPLTYPVHDAQGRHAGVLILAVDLLQLQARVLGPSPTGAVVAAADRSGTIVMRSIDPAAWLGKPAPPQHLALARQGRPVATQGVDQVQRLYAHATVPGVDWVVVAGVPEAEVLAEPRGWLLRSAVAGAIVLAAVLLLAWRVARAVIAPTHALAQAAARVARGDVEARAPVGGPADIGEVAQRFNEMLDVLAESQHKYRAIIDSALDAVVQMDAAGLIVGWNARAETMFGWPASQAIGRRLHETIIPPSHRDAHVRGLAQYHASGQGPVLNRLIEIEALRRDGRVFPVELTVTVLQTQDGPEFTAFVRDIEGRKRAEAERRALESQLRESQKMEAIGTLAGGIAHDFNNIIGAILGNVALMRQDIGDNHAATARLEQVHKATLRARGLVQQILAYSRRQPQRLASRPLAPLVREAAALLRATLPAGVALDLVLEDAPLHVLCDATQMQQVLMNLCTNAWHAMEDGNGRIEIGLAAAAFDAAAARPRGLSAGPCVHLWVADNGRGMDAATRERIFEPFFTTKAVGEGTGLGLSVVQGIVAAHGGAVVVDSTPGRGSSFHLYFPSAAAGDEGEPTAPAAFEATPSGDGRHVLYIDDDEVMMLMVEQLLMRAGFRVTAHGNPRDAVAAVRRQPAQFDIVVSDFNMPEVSGLDVAREMSSLRTGLPVVISSGLVTDDLREQAQRAGARAVLQKENTFEELVPLLQRLLAGISRP